VTKQFHYVHVTVVEQYYAGGGTGGLCC
jgi:hypothetical protein